MLKNSNKISILFFIFFTTTSFAQIEDSIEKKVKFLIGIEQNSVYKMFGNKIKKNGFNTNNIDISFLLKKEIINSVNFRIGLGRIIGNKFTEALNSGIEKKILLSNNLSIYVGADILYYTYSNSAYKSKFFGIGPLVGIDFKLGRRFLIGTESSIAYGKSDMIDGELKWGVIDTYKFLSLHVYYKF